jgi:hypothetical protein
MARVIVDGPCLYVRISEESPCPDFGIVPKGTKINDPPKCKYTYIDAAGHVLSRRFDYARRFSEGVAPVQIDTRWAYIDKTGNLVVQPRFDMAEPFSDGVARVRKGDLYGYLDHSGAFVIDPQFKHADDFHDGRAVVGDLQSSYWYTDHSGKKAFEGEFSLASPFFKGLAHVRVAKGEAVYGGTFAYIDTTGRRVFTYNSR